MTPTDPEHPEHPEHPKYPKYPKRRPAASARGGASGERDELVQRIRATIDSIPLGRVATYGQVAAEAGRPRAARLVARALSSLPPGHELPWQRVLRSDGKHLAIAFPVGSRQARRQARRLRAEGVRVDARGRVEREGFGWRPGP